MSNAEQSLVRTMMTLDELEESMKNELIVENKSVMALKINEFTSCLQGIYDAGRDMDEISLLPIRSDIFNFLDGEITNPELYQHKTFEDAEAKAKVIADRIDYLQTISNVVTETISKPSTAAATFTNSDSSITNSIITTSASSLSSSSSSSTSALTEAPTSVPATATSTSSETKPKATVKRKGR